MCFISSLRPGGRAKVRTHHLGVAEVQKGTVTAAAVWPLSRPRRYNLGLLLHDERRDPDRAADAWRECARLEVEE